MGKYACASKASQTGLKSQLFQMARVANAAADVRITQLEEGSVVKVEQPVVDSIEKETEKTLCSGTFVLSLPPGSKAASGLDEVQSIAIRYSVQATADRKGSVYRIFGADELAHKIAGKTAVAKAAPVATANPQKAIVTPSVPSQSQSGGAYHYIRGLDPNGDNWLALRPEPSMKGARIAKLGPDTLLLSDGTRVGIWLKVETLDGRKGWVASRFTACCK